MAGLLNSTTALPGEWKQYNGQQVSVGQDQMDKLNSSVAAYNKATGGNMTAQEYDKQLNPTSYGARWGVAESGTTPAPSGLLNATAAPAQPSVATYDPIKATSGTATTTKATATNAGSTGYTAANVNLKPEASAAYQLNQITSADSPLNTAARTFADQQSNRRGLLNSSIAVGASQDAVLKNAMPLAQQDANTNFQAGMADASATNRASEFTSGASNTAALTNAQLGTQTSQFNAGAENDTSKFNVQQDAQTSQFNAGSGNTALASRAQAANTQTLQVMQNQNAQELARIQADTTMSVEQKRIASAQLLADKDQITKYTMADKEVKGLMERANLDAATQAKINGMNNDAKVQLAEITAANDALIKNNQSAAGLMQQAMVGLAGIATSTMDQAAKDMASLNLLNSMKNSLDAINNYDKLRLSQYFPTSDDTPGATPNSTYQTTPTPTPQTNIGAIEAINNEINSR